MLLEGGPQCDRCRSEGSARDPQALGGEVDSQRPRPVICTQQQDPLAADHDCRPYQGDGGVDAGHCGDADGNVFGHGSAGRARDLQVGPTGETGDPLAARAHGAEHRYDGDDQGAASGDPDGRQGRPAAVLLQLSEL